jgi:hypothetical protein
MATNGLSTTFGGVEGEGWIKVTVPTTQGATAVQLIRGLFTIPEARRLLL